MEQYMLSAYFLLNIGSGGVRAKRQNALLFEEQGAEVDFRICMQKSEWYIHEMRKTFVTDRMN